ncbi:hypothetical protein [Kribbella jiaozuonensis]|uniref:Uncharacterized protein n=1 Tax=Kribbella jiaozuonensis TaxID=2575441 RepID=A0A4V5UY35_9ACTN|nr:hypothetical protein [Kribbella jiaozuonensis]TKK83093.1 hypothetical protein FDA38_10290 [Kribbella jiaozuonensis]
MRARLFTPVRALATMLLSIAGVAAAVFVLVSSALVPVGIGLYAVPLAVWLRSADQVARRVSSSGPR